MLKIYSTQPKHIYHLNILPYITLKIHVLMAIFYMNLE